MPRKKIPQGRVLSDKSYQWQCFCDNKPDCPYCCNMDLDKIKASLKTSRGQVYYGNLKAFLSIEGRNIYLYAKEKAVNGFSPRDLLEVTDRFLYRSRTRIIAEWLEETQVLPAGAYELLKYRGFKPCEITV
jgi:hypothetical protein